MIIAKNLTFTYPEQDTPVLKDVSISVKRGEFVLLCGASGCGKSTLLRTLNGMIPNISDGTLQGKVTVDGKTLSETPMYELAKMIGTVFQNPKSQFFDPDSDSELAFAMENAGCPAEKIRERLENLTSLFEIQHLRGRNIYEISGGEKQILAIATVCMNDPDVLILDEPTANLDQAAVQIMQKILGILKAQGKTIVIAEHRLSFLRELADTVYILQEGSIGQIMTGKEFFSMDEDMRLSLGLRQLAAIPMHISERPVQGEELLSAKNISVSYRSHKILDDIFFRAYSGDIIGITGKNGAGKSTLFRTMCGLQKPGGGHFSINSKACREKQLRELSCIIMQDVNYQLFGESVVGECRSAAYDADEAEINALLEQMKLSEWRDSHPMALSGGQKQRLAIAAGILQHKKVYLFDEPTSGLDLASMMKVRDEILKLSRAGAAVFVITHDMELLDLVCSRCFFMQNGSMTELFADDGFSRLVMKKLC
jgi:energy-coupling factor transport system ATP-binding protein